MSHIISLTAWIIEWASLPGQKFAMVGHGKDYKSEITFAAFNSTKITSVYSALFRKVLLAQT